MTPINMINVICDTTHMKSLRLRCTCGNEWIERIPEELMHFHHMMVDFECPKCKMHHLMHNGKFRLLTKEEYHDRLTTEQNETFAFGKHSKRTDEDFKYDA